MFSVSHCYVLSTAEAALVQGHGSRLPEDYCHGLVRRCCVNTGICIKGTSDQHLAKSSMWPVPLSDLLVATETVLRTRPCGESMV